MGDYGTDTTRAFLSNDERLLKMVYCAVYPRVKKHILKNNGSEAQAKDIYQEAFISCWRNIREGKFQSGNVEGYLFTIAKNKWTDYLRSVKYRKTVSSDSNPNHIISVSEEGSERIRDEETETSKMAMNKAMGQLGENCRTLLKLFYYERRSLEEIATEMGIAPNSARNQKYRCMKKLRTLSLQIKYNGQE